jgi:hypothetical protein
MALSPFGFRRRPLGEGGGVNLSSNHPAFRLEELDPANDTHPLTDYVQGQADALRGTEGSSREAFYRLSDRVTELARDFKERAYQACENAARDFNERREHYAAVLRDAATLNSESLEEALQGPLQVRAAALAEAEVTKKALEPEVTRLQYGVFGDPELGRAYKPWDTALRVSLFLVLFAVLLGVEFFMNFDLMQTMSDEKTAYVTTLALAGILTFAVEWSSSRFRAYSGHLNALWAFSSKTNKKTYNDPQAGEVRVFPLEPLFWISFWVPHFLLLGLIVGLIWLRCSIILSEQFPNWGSLLGTLVLAGVLAGYYGYKAMMYRGVVHPRMHELRDIQAKLEAANNTIAEIKQGEDAESLAIRKMGETFLAERKAFVLKAIGERTGLIQAQATLARLIDHVSGKLPEYGAMFVSAYHSLERTLRSNDEFEGVSFAGVLNPDTMVLEINPHLTIDDWFREERDFVVPELPNGFESAPDFKAIVRQHWDRILTAARAEAAKAARERYVNNRRPIVAPVSNRL